MHTYMSRARHIRLPVRRRLDSAAGPPRAKFRKLDLPATVFVQGREGRVHLRVRVADAQRVEQKRKLGFVDPPVGIAIEAIEAVAQRVGAHAKQTTPVAGTFPSR